MSLEINKYVLNILPLKTPVGKIESMTYDSILPHLASYMRTFESKLIKRKGVQYDVPLKTPLKPSGKKNIRRKQNGISEHLYLYCLIKNLYEKPLGKNSSREKEYNIYDRMIIDGL